MKKMLRCIGFVVALGAVLCAFASRPTLAQGVPGYGSVKLTWKTLPLIQLSITPNYQTGFGPQGGTGSGSTPAPGPGATLGGGTVDFGTQVVQGYAYLYKYAAQATVQSTDASGFTVYAEGSSDVQDVTKGGTVPLSQMLFWLPSSSGNGPFSTATAFNATASPTGCSGTCINYPGNPPNSAIVWNYPNSTIGQAGNQVAQGWDYELRLYNGPSPDSFEVYIVYTAVGN